jgi:cellobiose phosphorylase
MNPVNHGKSVQGIERYKVEPYVVAADVYAIPPHTGRGGWTWYTGSAAWMYRLIVESLLGLTLETNKLSFTPCLPPEWDGFTVHYRFRETVYHIKARQRGAEEATTVVLDGVVIEGKEIPLFDDRKVHFVEVMVAS